MEIFEDRVEITNPGRAFSYLHEPRDIFVGKSARIVRCLLADRERIWTQGGIVPRCGAISGLVSRIIKHLVHQGFAEKPAPVSFDCATGRGFSTNGRKTTALRNAPARLNTPDFLARCRHLRNTSSNGVSQKCPARLHSVDFRVDPASLHRAGGLFRLCRASSRCCHARGARTPPSR